MTDRTADRPRVSLATPQIRVTNAEGDTYVVQTQNADLVAYDVTAYKHKWPPMKDAPFLWLTFLAWHASRRLGRIPSDQTYEQFRDTVLSVDSPDGDDQDGEVGPTGPGPGSV